MAYGYETTKDKTEIDSEQTASDLAAAKAQYDSPNFSGTPTVPNANSSTKTTQIASTRFVKDVFNLMFPVGTIIYLAAASATPAYGTWTKRPETFRFYYNSYNNYINAYAWTRTA